jgi:hypothetical protein
LEIALDFLLFQAVFIARNFLPVFGYLAAVGVDFAFEMPKTRVPIGAVAGVDPEGTRDRLCRQPCRERPPANFQHIPSRLRCRTAARFQQDTPFSRITT